MTQETIPVQEFALSAEELPVKNTNKKGGVNARDDKRRKAATSPTQRTLKWLREQGYQACVVERWKPIFDSKTKEMRPFGVRVDAFGYGDILACKPGEGIFLIQCSTGDNHAKRALKIKTECQWEASEWRASGGRILVISWTKKGGQDERKLWTPRVEELV